MPVAPGCGEGAYLGLPEGLLGNAHTKPGWSSRDCSVLSVQEALGFGYGSEIELKACLLPVYQRFQHPMCKRAERWGGPGELCFPSV